MKRQANLCPRAHTDNEIPHALAADPYGLEALHIRHTESRDLVAILHGRKPVHNAEVARTVNHRTLAGAQ